MTDTTSPTDQTVVEQEAAPRPKAPRRSRKPKVESSQESEGFQPVTFWLAGPDKMAQQVRIFRPNNRKPLRFERGRLTVHTEQDYELVKRVMVGKAWEEDDLPADEVVVCQQCGYAPRSLRAFIAHQDLHPIFRQG